MLSNKKNIATAIALLFHVSGAIGMLATPYRQWFIDNTPLNLLLMAALLIWCQPGKNRAFWFFLTIAFGTGMAVEIIGVNTGWLFGNYSYGKTMGPQLKGVPWLIGVNWMVVVYCSGVLMHQAHLWLLKKYEASGTILSERVTAFSLVLDGALLAALFDWVMEPVAMQLDFWQWENGIIPLYNYVCWFLVSLLLLVVFRWLPFRKDNQFAVHLFFIQVLFFLALRTYL